MIIRTLSQKRGIIALYDGSKYIIFSTFYGVVAESTSVERQNEGTEETQVEIKFDICKWFGYWDLQSIISRGIIKFETEYVPKRVVIHYHEIENEHEHLYRRLVMNTEKY